MVIPILMHFCSLERCKPHNAVRHLMKCDVINDVKLLPTVYHRIYCRKFWRYPISSSVTRVSTLESLFCSMIAVINCTIMWKSSRFPNEFQSQWYIIRPYDSPALSKIAKNIHNNKLHVIKKDERLSIKLKLKVDIHQTLFSVLSLHWAQLPAKLTVLRANPRQ